MLAPGFSITHQLEPLHLMSVNFLPGQPNHSSDSCCFANWNTIQILAYTSGNNLVILTKNSKHLQTIYLPKDSYTVDLNRSNGKIAIAIDNEVHIYTPEVSNYYNFNFHGRKNIDELEIEWTLEHVIVNENDTSKINSLCWSDYTVPQSDELELQFMELPREFNSKTTCELVTGSDSSLAMHKLYYDKADPEENVKCTLIWFKKQPNPIYKVKFSPNATCIASIGFYDKHVKLWNRNGFSEENLDFELHYLPHDTFVTDIIWKRYVTSNSTTAATKDNTSSKSSESFILKPVNSIIKHDCRLMSDESSIHSSTLKEYYHNTLYTFTYNSNMRVFSTFRLDRGFEIFESGRLDLYQDDPSKRGKGILKTVTFIDNQFLELELEDMLKKFEASSTKLDHSMKMQNKILDLLKLKCELCIVVGSDGVLTLYLLSNLCNVLPSKMTINKLDKLRVDGKSYLSIIKLSKYCLPSHPSDFIVKSIQIDHYSKSSILTLVLHDCFKHTIRVINIDFTSFLQFDRSKYNNEGVPLKHKVVHVGRLAQKFTGHNKSIRRLIRSADGSSVLSLTRFQRTVLWTPISLSNERKTLTKRCVIVTDTPIQNAVIWNNSHYAIVILERKIIVFDCVNTFSNLTAQEVAMLDIDTALPPDCVFLLPETSKSECHIVMVNKDRSCKCFRFSVHPNNNGDMEYKLEKYFIDPLPNDSNDEIYMLSAVDPVGWMQSIDRVGRAILVTVTPNGRVFIYYVSFSKAKDGNGLIRWHLKDSFKTGINNCSLISVSSINKMALVDETRSKLSIWDMKVSVRDYYEEFENEVIKDLDWTSTEFDQGILAVGFKSHSLLYTQLRHDYTNQRLSFVKIKKVDLSHETTHEIGDSIWMGDGNLVIGAGNQLYLSDKKLDATKDEVTRQAIGSLEIRSNDLFHLCAVLNGPLPLYHPQFIIQSVFLGMIPLVKIILLQLSHILREIDLGVRREDDFGFDIQIEKVMTLLSNIVNQNEDFYSKENDDLNEQGFQILTEKLQKIKLPFLTGHQQITLLHTIYILKDITLYQSKVLDISGLKFFLAMKLFTVNMTNPLFVSTHDSISMRDISFALHSDNRDLLYGLLEEKNGNQLNWNLARSYLLPYWLDITRLQHAMEKIAANEFLKFQRENGGRKDPSTCSIFYLALKKKKVLVGLWKTSFGNPEREKMIKFLSNDFTEKRWKSAANKNAYVLLGKHRYMDAASFFLLAGSPKDAVNVIVRQIKDIPLAIAVARCYDGIDDGVSVRTVIERQMLTDAITTNDRWKLSWIFWILGDKIHSVQSLIKPLHKIKDDVKMNLPDYQWPNIDSVVKTTDTEDPVLLIMYDSLRKRNVKYYQGISMIEPKHEFSFVIKAATMYTKMGCDWLALYLLRTWEFSEANNEQKAYIMQAGQEEEVKLQKPGDILAKFMSPSGSSNSREPPKELPSLLDNYTDFPHTPSILCSPHSEEGKEPSLLDKFSSGTSSTPSSGDVNTKKVNIGASTSGVPNLLDNWA